MQNVPKIVRDRLRAAPPAVNHPDADLLTAFAERSLTDRERAVVLEHLARCGDCRDIVALSLPEIESVQTAVRPSPSGWFTWPALRWGFVAAGVVAIASLGILQFQRRSQPATTASALKQPAPVEIAANEPKKEVDRFVAPTADKDKKAKLQAPATPAFADSVNGAVAADVEKKDAFHGEPFRRASLCHRLPRLLVAMRARPLAARYLTARDFRINTSSRTMSRIRFLLPRLRRSRSSSADDLPVNGRVPAASEAVVVAGAAPVAAAHSANLDAQLAESKPAIQTPSAADSADTLAERSHRPARPRRSRRSSGCKTEPPPARSEVLWSIPVEPRCPMLELRSLPPSRESPLPL